MFNISWNPSQTACHKINRQLSVPPYHTSSKPGIGKLSANSSTSHFKATSFFLASLSSSSFILKSFKVLLAEAAWISMAICTPEKHSKYRHWYIICIVIHFDTTQGHQLLYFCCHLAKTIKWNTWHPTDILAGCLWPLKHITFGLHKKPLNCQWLTYHTNILSFPFAISRAFGSDTHIYSGPALGTAWENKLLQ